MLQPHVDQLVAEDANTTTSNEENLGTETEVESPEVNPFSFTPQLIRLHKDHELFEDGDIQRHLYLQDVFISDVEDKPALSVSEFACHISGCSAVFGSLDDYEHHYNSLHRHVCSSCRRSLPSARLLDIHIQEWHDSVFSILAQKQDMYLCLVEGCGLKFRTSIQRKDHLIRVHKYPPDFRFDKNKKEKGEAKRLQQKDAAMEVEACESEGVGDVLCNVPSDDPEQEESMETRVSGEEAAAETNSAPPKPQYSYRVPSTVCFGHGSVRGFRGRQTRRK